MYISELPKILVEDPKIVEALNLGHTVYVFNLGDFEYTVVVMDGNTVSNAGEVLAQAPKEAKTLYLIIPTSKGPGQSLWRYLYTIEDYRKEITPSAAALNAD